MRLGLDKQLVGMMFAIGRRNGVSCYGTNYKLVKDCASAWISRNAAAAAAAYSFGASRTARRALTLGD